MKKRNKIIITMLMVITMLSVMAVTTFASGNVLEGGDAGETVDTTDIIGTWVFNDTISLIITNHTEFNITFNCNSVQYTKLTTFINSNSKKPVMYYGSTTVYSGDFEDPIYKTIEITDYNVEQEAEILELLNTNATKTAPLIPIPPTIGILDVANEIPSFLVNVFVPLISIFYADGAFTIIGVLSLAAFAFFLILLLFQVIKRFVQFRG